MMSRARYRLVCAVLACVGALGSTARPAQAHEIWFVHDPRAYPVDFRLLFSWPMLLALIIGAGAVVTARFIDQRYRTLRRQQNPNLENALLGIGEGRLRRVYAYLPLLLAVHTAIPLLVSGFQLQLFSPENHMQLNLLSGLLALAEVLIALALLYGVFTDIAALGLIGLLIAGLVLGPFVGIFASWRLLQHVEFVGIAVFLYIIGRGPFSADALLGRRAHPDVALVRYAIPALRWSLGVSIIVLALVEKLLNPRLAAAFLHEKIDFNFLNIFGVSDQVFIVLAGIGELTFGLLLISGALTRLVIIVMWVPFNLTLPYLGWVELAGHLPIYAIMLLLLIVGPTSRRAAERSAVILAREAGALQEARAQREAALSEDTALTS